MRLDLFIFTCRITYCGDWENLCSTLLFDHAHHHLIIPLNTNTQKAFQSPHLPETLIQVCQVISQTPTHHCCRAHRWSEEFIINYLWGFSIENCKVGSLIIYELFWPSFLLTMIIYVIIISQFPLMHVVVYRHVGAWKHSKTTYKARTVWYII